MAFASAFVLIAPFLFWLRFHLRQPIAIIPLQGQDHDLTVMKSRFKYARDLTVFAGDFDFVSRDAKMRAILRKVHEKHNLTLVSSKSENAVRTGFGDTAEAISLFEGLKAKGSIFFDNPVAIKCSIVRAWRESEVIYRYDGGGSDNLATLNICILFGRREARPVIELLEKLVTRALHVSTR